MSENLTVICKVVVLWIVKRQNRIEGNVLQNSKYYGYPKLNYIAK